jgi:hypothetical protein
MIDREKAFREFIESNYLRIEPVMKSHMRDSFNAALNLREIEIAELKQAVEDALDSNKATVILKARIEELKDLYKSIPISQVEKIEGLMVRFCNDTIAYWDGQYWREYYTNDIPETDHDPVVVVLPVPTLKEHE